MNPFDTAVSRRNFLLGTAAASAAIALPAGQGAFAQASKEQLVIGHTTFRHLNPAIQSGQATAVPGTQIFASLIRIDENFAPQPYLAESWESSEDGLSHTFRLRSGATFHDGKPITSKDVAFSLNVVKENHPFGKVMFSQLEAVETPDELIAVIKLSKPQPALLQSLAPPLAPILPEHVYGAGDIRQNPANTETVGSGPFKFKEYRSGEYLILERYDGYFLDKPHFKELLFKVTQDPLVNVLGLERGEIDYLPFALVQINSIQRLKDNAALVVTKKGYEAFGATNYLEFNLRHEPLNDVRVRKAIAHAIDKDFIAQRLLRGEGVRLDGPLTASNPLASKDLNLYAVDLDKAKALLDEAGHKADGSGKRLTFTLEWLPDANINSQEPVANYLKAQLAKIGIEIVLRPNADFASYATRVGNWEHQLLLNGMWNYPDPVIGVHRAYLRTNIRNQIYTNTSGYSNPEVDEILGQAAVENDVEKRKALYARFQSIVTDELPICWTNEEPLYTIYAKNLQNPPMSVWGPLSPYDRVSWA